MAKQQRYFRIGEVSKLTGIPIHRLRYWEKKIPALRPRRTQGGHRLYTYEQVERFRQVARLVQDLGLPLERVRDIITGKNPSLQRLLTIYNELGEIEDFLLRFKDFLHRVSE